MNTEKAYWFFANNFQLVQSSNGWFNMDCPACGKEKKLAVNFEQSDAKCWRCHYRGHILDVIMKAKNVAYRVAKELVEGMKPPAFSAELLRSMSAPKATIIQREAKVTLPDGFTPLLEGGTVLGNRARAYLQGRGFNLEKLDRQGFGYCREHATEYKKDFYGYVIVPFKRDGQLSYYLGRNYLSTEPRYKNPPKEFIGAGKGEVIFNESALYMQDEVYITEGWADAATMGDGGTSTQGWSMSIAQKNKYMTCPAHRLVFVPDAGKDAYKGTSYYQLGVKLATDFLNTGKEVYVVDLNQPELAQYGKDINEIGRDRVLATLAYTKQLTLSTAVNILM